jgi:hypothetical protein
MIRQIGVSNQGADLHSTIGPCDNLLQLEIGGWYHIGHGLSEVVCTLESQTGIITFVASRLYATAL